MTARVLTLAECIDVHHEWQRGEGDNPPFPWGVEFLDRELGPARPGSLTIVAADTNVGKSFFALLMTTSSPIPSLLVEIEDTPDEVGRRVQNVPAEALQRPRVAFSRGSLGEVAEAIRAAASEGVRLVVVDYLTLLSYDGPHHVWARNDEVRECLKELKAIGRELNLVVVVVSQVKRREGAGDKPPSIFDLAESAAVERSAETVIILHRIDRHVLNALVAKAKHRPVGGSARFQATPPHGWLVQLEDPTSDEDIFA